VPPGESNEFNTISNTFFLVPPSPLNINSIEKISYICPLNVRKLGNVESILPFLND
jgi:hypothetical protein